MLEFKPFSINTLKEVLPYLKKNPSLCSDLSIGYLYMWHEDLDIGFCVYKDTLVVKENIGEQPAFSYPIGNNVSLLIEELKEYTFANHLPLRFFAIDELTLKEIQNNKKLSPIMYAYDRKWSDYIYSFNDALTFKGKKYSGQRNHINKFKKLYGEPNIRLLTINDKDKVMEMLDEYEIEHPDSQALEKLELERTKKLFDTFEDLGLYSAGMFIDDKIIAFSIGEIVNNSLIIHVEKALIKYKGAYPTMYSGFTNLINEHLNISLDKINREDDSGDMGLRTSKMQYQPIFIAHKYLVHYNSPLQKLSNIPSFSFNNIILSKIKETDKEAYLKLNTDIENNLYWGYDYRKDLTISFPIDENTFYDSLKYDMEAGDSLNFAIRLKEDGEMIGEAIIWNLTSDGFAELGCRILPQYQGNGYGIKAFGALEAFVSKYLKNIKVYAKCYHSNIKSFKMITANGFEPVYKDDTYYYFEKGMAKTSFIKLCPSLAFD